MNDSTTAIETIAPTAPHRLILPPNLAALSKIAAKYEHTKYATTGVKIEAHDGGSYRAIATDGRRLVIVDGPAPVKDDEYPHLPGLADAPNSATSAVVPAKAWESAFKMVPKRTSCKPALGNLACVLNEERFTAGATDLENYPTAATRNVEGYFPNYIGAIPIATPKATIDVDAKQLRELLAVAEQFTDCETKRVTLEIRDEKTPLVLRLENGAGQKFTGVIVPLVRR